MKKVKGSKDMTAFSQKTKFLNKLKILVSGSRVAVCHVNEFTTKAISKKKFVKLKLFQELL